MVTVNCRKNKSYFFLFNFYFMKKFIFSDFDGTLTTKDSMMSIIIYQRGRLGLVLALLRILPWLILMFMGRYSNQRTKEQLLHHCFGRMTVEEFNDLCQRFADSHRHILRNNLYDKLVDAKANGDEVVVVTASPENWVSRLVPEFKVLGTKMEFNPCFTGRFHPQLLCTRESKPNTCCISRTGN